ncbi:RDD family protein [Paractinoplanes brasiliensis]|uniref:Putative RDD family membrane protein YckC n=1 Tax=Paractinoplanes brasiliensis TaxID=52695 RepID=A0A4R6JAH7_9ACTN|nr:RDD family protein [Actinoplanes brasiliensis]TDO31456.1 putative RDD family membrane protein YckC [Actinoplanes brasiliensis]GID30852.1 RDD family protein [Actinoplanes brasiliensis]
MNTYAGLVSRFLAYVLDALIVSVLAGAAAAVLGLVASVVGYEARELARAVVSTYVVFLPALLAIYCALFWLLAGRTPGMAVLGLRVVTTRGGPVRWLAALVRALVLAYFPIGALWLLVNRRHQGIHDKIARTAVVRSS